MKPTTVLRGADWDRDGDVNEITIPGLSAELTKKMFPYGAIAVARVGSDSHGTKISKADDSIDDTDLMGVFIGPIEAYFGFGRERTIERKFAEYGEFDCVSYDIRHFVSLLAKGNPNVLGMLWMPDEHVLHRTPIFDMIVRNRHVFATKSTYYSFAGYARGQLHQMQHFDGPARRRMADIEAELTFRGIPLDAMPEQHQHESRPARNTRPFGNSEDRVLVLEYRQMCSKYTSGYMGAKRRELVDKHGYDTKNAAHLIRLLRMAEEFLLTGNLRVDRSGHDADELIAVKKGERTFDEIQKQADELFIKAKAAYEASPLPQQPDDDAVESLLVTAMELNFNQATNTVTR